VNLVQLIVLALIQGFTEYLPVSSSAHLILGSMVFGWPDQGLVVDTATHLGTLFAVLVYFRRDLLDMTQACLRPVSSPADRRHRSMAMYLLLASIPALLLGALAHDWIGLYLRDMRVVAWSTLVFGVLLWIADAKGSRQKEITDFNLKSALWVGLAQALALVPGTSRSGVTITAARFLGFSSDAAARFSFLLSIPIVGAAGLYSALKIAGGESNVEWAQFFIVVGVSALAGWVCITAFLALLKRVGLMPFVVYRLMLGVLLLWIIS
jgi:undecaprenyl-diphosphatase